MCKILREIHNIMGQIEILSIVLGFPISKNDYKIEDLGIPHNMPKLQKGKCAVYMFFYNDLALKIGKVNEKSNARYSYQHYGFNAKSTLAKSIVSDKNFLSEHVNSSNVSEWIKSHTRRIDIIVDVKCGDAAVELIEAIMHYRFRPRYEGALHRKSNIK